MKIHVQCSLTVGKSFCDNMVVLYSSVKSKLVKLTYISCHSRAVVEQFAESEICDFDEAPFVFLGQENVLQLQVAVTNVVVVKVLDPF